MARLTIEAVMLEHEDGIEEDAHIAETQLDRVSRQARPVVLQRRVQDELQQRQYAARYVQQDLVDAPAHGRLALVVDPGLRDVLDDGDDELDVA